VWGKHRLLQAVEVCSIGAHCVPDVAHVIHTLCAVEHVKQAVVIHHAAVEDVERFPLVKRIGLENRIGKMALQLHVNPLHSLQMQFLGKMAGDEVTRLNFPELRFFFPADVLSIATARMEVAAAGRVRRVGHIALHDNAL